jgi:hypothetical protein
MFVPEYDNNRTEGVADAASLRFEAPPSCAKLCGHIVNKSGDPPHQIICRVTAAALQRPFTIQTRLATLTLWTLTAPCQSNSSHEDPSGLAGKG